MFGIGVLFGDDVAIGEPELSNESGTLVEELMNVLSSLVRFDNELNVLNVFTLNVSKIPVAKFGTPQFIQHHEMSFEPRILHIF